jgi:hypothetical protein
MWSRDYRRADSPALATYGKRPSYLRLCATRDDGQVICTVELLPGHTQITQDRAVDVFVPKAHSVRT